MTRSFFTSLPAVAVFVFMSACSVSKDTVVVTERAERPLPIPSTEGPSEMEVPKDNVPAGVASGKFDGGKMWTFDNPPISYFRDTYEFEPDTSWFNKARKGALRFSTYCSASFVSASGLVMTNHHCGRESITSVSKDDENLLDNGFYAATPADERKVDDLYVDQLISIKDVTKEVYDAGKDGSTLDAKNSARSAFAEGLAKRLTTEAKAADTTMTVEVIALYNGGQYSAYTFKRYHDVRLVMAPELAIGFFGGDPDNFTYPRYNLDMSFFRVYKNGRPYKPASYFAWSTDGAKSGEPVFVIGNPGSTSRLMTVSQLEFERDENLPQQIKVLESRAAIMADFIDKYPERADELDLRNTYFSILNTIKSTRGQLTGLKDPAFLLRRQDAENNLKDAIAANDSLAGLYKNLFRDIEDMQRAKEAVANESAAFTYFSSELLTSHVLLRALYGYVHDLLKQRGAPADQTDDLIEDARKIEDWPAAVERQFIAERLKEMRSSLGPSHPSMVQLFKDTNPQALADSIIAKTALLDSTGYDSLLGTGYLSSGDVTVAVMETIAPLFFSLGQQLSSFEEREQALNSALGRAQFAIYGHSVPPDASFSPRIADGVVAGYEYNGTAAPAFVTFYGLYDRANSYPGRTEWDLPERWKTPPTSFDLSTPINLVSTNDITGGNSGSPLLNRQLEVVGLAFDSNIEALPNEYLYRDDQGRTISVDSRGMLEALREIYRADRIVHELVTSGTTSRASSQTE